MVIYGKGSLDPHMKPRGTRLTHFLLHLHPRRIPAELAGLKPTFCLGGLAAFFFFILLFTGILLMFFFNPGSQAASILIIEEVVTYGWLIRGLHKWAGQAMVALVFLHMLRVAVQGAYRPPREGNWVIGTMLLLLTLLLDFSGYLLVGDATAILARQVAGGILAAIPVIGPSLVLLLLGGAPGSGEAGLRIYVWHCFGLTLALGLLMFWHFYRVRKDGGLKGGY